ncbi:bifunctional nuclease 2 isoform X2 [Phoenix dactylifera]|uniref:Bifunctional nuclease 2 isoform X2 n=1 Tax=Phoenix dactylifera TaxID=42345 RepID=A0A8B8ZI37_PHODC|nr:bifunctional nuclease 2 isoform X2 [Phoenix dactylifera]
MLRIQTHSAAVPPGFAPSSSSPTADARFLSSSAKFSKSIPLFVLRFDRSRRRRSLLRPCKASLGNGDRGTAGDGGGGCGADDDDQFLQAFLLLSETVRHYNLWKQGFAVDEKRNLLGHRHSFSHRAKGENSSGSPFGQGFLRRFQSPTIFLKIACDGDLLLPIIVEFAIRRLISDSTDDQHEEFPDQFQFVKNIVGTFGYEVKMVRITERVVNTYYARIFLGKHTERANMSIDARPSDAIIVAKRFQAPIYVSKAIVLTDAVKIVHGTSRGSGGKTVYDVSMDSAAEGPDPLVEELDLVRKMNTAVMEERYEDAAVLRDKLAKLRMPRQEL